MEIRKVEKNKNYVNENFEEIKNFISKYGEVEVILHESDFNDELSVPYGFGWQDFTEKNKELIIKLLQYFDVSFLPYLCEDDSMVKVIIKKK